MSFTSEKQKNNVSQSKNEDFTIQFKPLSEGLGLNHFSDGLPYASHASLARGARPSRLPTPSPVPPPRLTVSPTLSEAALSAALAAVEGTKHVARSADSGTLPFSELPTPGSRALRAAAFLVDLVIVFALYGAVLVTAFGMSGISGLTLRQIFFTKDTAITVISFFLVFYFGYFFILELAWRKSLGKALFGLRVESQSSLAILMRNVLFVFSLIPMAVGLIWSLFDARHRCWHDVVSGCEIVRDHERSVS